MCGLIAIKRDHAHDANIVTLLLRHTHIHTQTHTERERERERV